MENKIYIFGAHSRARTTAKYITTIEPTTQVVGFLFNNEEDNPEKINGIDVVDITTITRSVCEVDITKNVNFENAINITQDSFEYSNSDICRNYPLNTDYPVYLATRSDSWPDITKSLIALGFKDIRPVDVELDSRLRNEFLSIEFNRRGERYEKLSNFYIEGSTVKRTDGAENHSKGIIFFVSSESDKELKKEYSLAEFEEPVQVGTELASTRLATVLGKNVSFFDNDTNDNISSLNKQFCELTGLYSIWKRNLKDYDYVGICHYRRHFILEKDVFDVMKNNGIKVALPVPLYVDPSLEDNYRFRHVGSDLDFVYQYVEVHFPDMAKEMHMFFQQGLYSPCNMFIATPQILNELCEWMFPILFSLYDEVGDRDDAYQNRYPGFISERLISFFFEYNKDRYHRVFVDKNFLV